MNELQKKEFELLKIFINVCEQLNLRYYLVCGSALGAVKYGGFIPWDDDIDVGMFREDYETFLREAPKLLPDTVFLQNYKSEKTFPMIYSKLRSSGTTYVESSSKNLAINHGVYLDVFPLDGYPEDAESQEKLERQKTKYKRRLACVYDVKRGLVSHLFCYYNRLCGYHKKTEKIVAALEKCTTRYPTANSQYICNHGNWQGRLEVAPKWHYAEGAQVSFEGLTVRVPKDYDAYLTQKYGDWRADLPPEEQVGHHYYAILDLERPYTDYIERVSKDGRRIWLKSK